MSYNTNFFIYLIFLLLTLAMGIIRSKRLLPGDRWILLLLIITVLQEGVAYICSVRFNNNLLTYHFYSPVELFVICCYFNHNILVLRRKRIGISIGITGILISILNTRFLQPLTSINSYFLLFEGCTIIVLCLLSLLQILLDEELNPYQSSNFWISVCFLFYWSITFAGWGLYGILVQRHLTTGALVDSVLYFSNLIFYLGISCIFFFYPRLIPSGE